MTISRNKKLRKEHIGGRLAANPRRANIAEGLAFQMMRSFAAIAPIPREEDFGIDAVATLIYHTSNVLTASDSFFVQVKTHTAASFAFHGNGVVWLRNLKLPYFPLVVNLDTATAHIYTLSRHRRAIHLGAMKYIVFVPDEASNGYDDFPLGEPLLSWSLADCTHRDFPSWAYSVLKPAIEIEALNLHYGPASRFFELKGDGYKFCDRNETGCAPNPPSIGEVWDYVPREIGKMFEALEHSMGPLAYAVSNTLGMEDKGPVLTQILSLMRNLGIDPDPTNKWPNLIKDMSE
jgi:hypothetical protein